MTIIKIAPNDNGSHSNQTSSGPIPLPDGWALVPEDVGTPATLENYPFGDITVEDLGGVPTVTRWTPLPIPAAPPEPTPEPTPEERNRADIDYLASLDGRVL